MHRIERSEISPFNQYEAQQAADPSEQMEREIKLAGIAFAWGICLLALVWLLAVLIRAGLRFEHWKWMVQR